jgi:tellurite resistance protein TehA-like permease
MPIITRITLAYLTIMGVAVGIWAFCFPLAFYSTFPGFGFTWVSVDGPFNQHLVRDVGAAFLMMGGLAGLGLLRPLLAAPFAVGFATLIFNLAHFSYHATHLGMFMPVDATLNVLILLSTVLCSVWLMLPQARMRE